VDEAGELGTGGRLTIELDPLDLGRISFAAAPAPLLESTLMLFELRHCPRPGTSGGLFGDRSDRSDRGGGSDRNGAGDWRPAARSAFAADGRPLLRLVPSRQHAYYLDVLTPDAEEAFHLVQATPESVHKDNVDRIERLNHGPAPEWLQRYADGDPALLRELDGALRAVHATLLAPRWPQVTARFHRDVAERMALMRRHGVVALLSTLSPDLHLRGLTLQGPYPWDRLVRLNGRGLTLMPSAFWTGHPLITWDPQDQSRYVLIYPAQAFEHHRDAHHAGDPLAMLLGATRAAVLRAVRLPRTTMSLARHVGISPSSASEHAATLRAAGLITSERHGQAVVHRISELGSALLWHD
jgi:DNA-binding transcriptional ArsR family regulator